MNSRTPVVSAAGRRVRKHVEWRSALRQVHSVEGDSETVAEKVTAVRYFLKQTPPKAGMAELADAADSKSAGPCGHGGSTPPPGTILKYLFTLTSSFG